MFEEFTSDATFQDLIKAIVVVDNINLFDVLAFHVFFILIRKYLTISTF